MKENKLTAKWSKKEKCIVTSYPIGCGTVCDSNYLFCDIFNKNFVDEMKNRGYDISSMRFEIKVDENNADFKKRFPSLAKELKK